MAQKMLETTNRGSWRRGNARLAARTLASILTLATCVAGRARPAFAQGAQDIAAAEVLFEEARKLLAAGNTNAACPKLEESQRLAPAVGTLLNLGICYQTAHRNASAWATFKAAISAARQAGQPEREALAIARANALEGKIATLTIRVPASVAKLPGLRIERDHEEVAPAGWGSPLPLDSGAHVITVSAPHHVSWTRTVRLGPDADAASLDAPPLAVSALAKTEAAPAPALAMTAAPKRFDAPSPLQKTMAVVVGVTGLASIATGSVLGVVAKNKNEDALANHCNYTNVCDARGVTLTNEARTSAVVSTIAVGAGGAAVLTGIVLFLTAPKTRPATAAFRASPTLDVHGGGVQIGGAW